MAYKDTTNFFLSFSIFVVELMYDNMVSRDNQLCASELFPVSSDCLIIAVICHYVALRRRQIRTERTPSHAIPGLLGKPQAISNEINNI
jgi:hypothetical protein